MTIQIRDRDQYFQRSWKSVWLELEGYSRDFGVNIDKPSFWGPNCRELISKHIGIWLIENNLTPWLNRKPPTLNLESKGGNQFLLKLTI